MKESDWKVFKKIKEKALDKFNSSALVEFQSIISQQGVSSHRKYGELYRAISDTDDAIAFLFDDHRRSRAATQLTALRNKDLTSGELVRKLSMEFQKDADPNRFRVALSLDSSGENK